MTGLITAMIASNVAFAGPGDGPGAPGEEAPEFGQLVGYVVYDMDRERMRFAPPSASDAAGLEIMAEIVDGPVGLMAHFAVEHDGLRAMIAQPTMIVVPFDAEVPAASETVLGLVSDGEGEPMGWLTSNEPTESVLGVVVMSVPEERDNPGQNAEDGSAPDRPSFDFRTYEPGEDYTMMVGPGERAVGMATMDLDGSVDLRMGRLNVRDCVRMTTLMLDEGTDF